ncbi:hypothetical protein NDU88_006433 [Pleurodeles waltl]|uniref:Uncharacterized protein n=1 Tax=Pleurodeles waltl TaxID=8319 RepID=A0AAV7N0T7_PLEWA|nr:hypothetical protein NDU88_006433 [Pleurodeles waltl]
MRRPHLTLGSCTRGHGEASWQRGPPNRATRLLPGIYHVRRAGALVEEGGPPIKGEATPQHFIEQARARFAQSFRDMEEIILEDQQDDLERMLAQMRSEALKRGKDWLRKKMEDATPEGGLSLSEDQQVLTRREFGDPQTDREHTPKPSKHQKSAVKPARKPAKRTRDPEQDTASPEAPETP